MVARGEVVWLEHEHEGRRPVVVLTRDQALPRLRNDVVALVTRTIRGIDTEVQLGPADGMPVECAVSLDNLRTVPQTLLTDFALTIASARQSRSTIGYRTTASPRQGQWRLATAYAWSDRVGTEASAGQCDRRCGRRRVIA